ERPSHTHPLTDPTALAAGSDPALETESRQGDGCGDERERLPRSDIGKFDLVSPASFGCHRPACPRSKGSRQADRQHIRGPPGPGADVRPEPPYPLRASGSIQGAGVVAAACPAAL